MGERPLARLEQVFPRLDVLTAPVRLRLSELLSVPTSVPAVLTQEIAELPLPTPIGDDVRRDVRLAIEKGLGPETLTALGTLRLADVVPPVRSCKGGPVGAACPARLRELLRRRGATAWVELGQLTLGEMARWPSMGPLTLASMVGAAVDAALATPSVPCDAADDQEPVLGPVPAALAVLLDHDNERGGGLRQALEHHAAGDGPAEVRATASQLLAAADRAGDPRLAPLDRAWEAAGDHRDRGVLVHRALRLDRRTPTRELAEAIGVTETRVGQIQARAEQQARLAAHGGGGEALEDLATDLRGRLGRVCRLAAVDDALAALRLPTRADPRSALLVWLAGPYHPLPSQAGWVSTDPAGVLAETRRLLHEDGGVRPSDHLAADLEAAGFAALDVGDWLAGQAVAVVDGLVVDLSGSAADVAERLLSATGRAMTAAELAATGATPHPATALDNRLRRDPRFVPVDRDHFELAEWGSAPFTEPPKSALAEHFPGAVRGIASPGRAQLRIVVDAAVLRGASDPVPLALVEALGVPCGGRRTFSTRFGPVALTHTASQPTRGSVRPVALAAGACAGDAVVLEFDAATGDASVELVLASSSAAS